MFRGWEVEYDDGKVIRESEMGWKSLPKNNMVRLTLHHDNRHWDIKDKVAYVQKKRASMVPGMASTFQIESRSIGYYDVVNGKACKVWYTVNELSGVMTMEVEHT